MVIKDAESITDILPDFVLLGSPGDRLVANGLMIHGNACDDWSSISLARYDLQADEDIHIPIEMLNSQGQFRVWFVGSQLLNFLNTAWFVANALKVVESPEVYFVESGDEFVPLSDYDLVTARQKPLESWILNFLSNLWSELTVAGPYSEKFSSIWRSSENHLVLSRIRDGFDFLMANGEELSALDRTILKCVDHATDNRVGFVLASLILEIRVLGDAHTRQRIQQLIDCGLIQSDGGRVHTRLRLTEAGKNAIAGVTPITECEIPPFLIAETIMR